jgi:hypothetical protein
MNESEQWVEMEDDVQRVMRPVGTPPTFRAHLRDGLLRAAQHQRNERTLSIDEADAGPSWAWLAGAALLGAFLSFILIRLSARKRIKEYHSA